MIKVFLRLAILILTNVFVVCPSFAQLASSEVRVVTGNLPPLVIVSEGFVSGFSIDLWNEISQRLLIKTVNYDVAYNTNELLDLVRNRQAQVGVGGISITSAREAEFDFSQPILNSGLSIMVRGRETGAESNPLSEIVNLLFSKSMLVWLGVAGILIIIPAHFIWFVERRNSPSLISSKKYFPGIFSALFWAASTLATQSDQMPRHWISRFFAIIWMFTGVVFVAFYTAQLTANITIQQIKGDINSPADLKGKLVAATPGSTAAAASRELGAEVLEVLKINEAVDALLESKIDAVVFDMPTLRYYAATKGKGKVRLVGNVFRKEDYGIIFAENDPLRKSVNNALLQMREDGSYQRIYDKWFATD